MKRSPAPAGLRRPLLQPLRRVPPPIRRAPPPRCCAHVHTLCHTLLPVAVLNLLYLLAGAVIGAATLLLATDPALGTNPNPGNVGNIANLQALAHIRGILCAHPRRVGWVGGVIVGMAVLGLVSTVSFEMYECLDSQTCIPEQHWFERPDPMELFCDPAVWDAESVKDILSFGLTANSAATSTSAAVSNGSAREPAGVDTYLGPSVFFRKCGTRYEFN